MKQYTVDTFVNTVMSLWRDGDLDDVIIRVFDKIKRVLIFIIKGNGENDLVKTKRGVEHADVKFDFILNSKNILEANKYTIVMEDEDDDVIQMDVEI